MLKQFLNTGSLKSLMLFDAESEAGAAEEKAKLREQLAKGNIVKEAPVVEKEEVEEEESEEEIESEEESEEEKVEETAEEKAAREASETQAAKDKRKEERIQKRIDKAVAAQRTAEAEVAKWRALAEAKPDDEKLTKEQVEARAEAIAAEKVAAKEMERAQADFNKACDKLQDAANKIDKEFTPKVVAMADELGPIPSRVIGILDDLENGAEVLKFMVDDIDEAEKIYDLKDKPERLAIALVRISDKLALAKKPPPKQISKVPDPMKPVNGNRVQSTQITQKDTTPEGMENYVRKRQLQIEQRRKQGR